MYACDMFLQGSFRGISSLFKRCVHSAACLRLSIPGLLLHGVHIFQTNILRYSQQNGSAKKSKPAFCVWHLSTLLAGLLLGYGERKPYCSRNNIAMHKNYFNPLQEFSCGSLVRVLMKRVHASNQQYLCELGQPFLCNFLSCYI